jgi:hypothetical protein
METTISVYLFVFLFTQTIQTLAIVSILFEIRKQTQKVKQ